MSQTNNSYFATLVNSKSSSVRELQGASSQGYGSVKAPYFNATFTMVLPAGVTLQSTTSSPKLSTTPSVSDAGVLTWALGSVRPGGKLKVVLKLAAVTCTTPAPLALNGKFSYADAAGSKTADAYLKKDLYVWANSCAPIPKPDKATGPGKSTTGTKAGESWNQCNCNACKVSQPVGRRMVNVQYNRASCHAPSDLTQLE